MIGNLYLQNFTSASGRWLYWFYIKLSPPHFTTNLRPCTKASQNGSHTYALLHIYNATYRDDVLANASLPLGICHWERCHLHFSSVVPNVERTLHKGSIWFLRRLWGRLTRSGSKFSNLIFCFILFYDAMFFEACLNEDIGDLSFLTETAVTF